MCMCMVVDIVWMNVNRKYVWVGGTHRRKVGGVEEIIFNCKCACVI